MWNAICALVGLVFVPGVYMAWNWVDDRRRRLKVAAFLSATKSMKGVRRRGVGSVVWHRPAVRVQRRHGSIVRKTVRPRTS